MRPRRPSTSGTGWRRRARRGEATTPVLDYTSALYLGLLHGSGSLRPWSRLSSGVPAALALPAVSRRVARKLAEVQGCERATLGPSTLHLFWDLFGLLAGPGAAVYFDEGAYPIVRWCVERAAARGVPVRSFRHHDVKALRGEMAHDAARLARPLVVTDGFCPGCARPAPLEGYLRCARERGGLLIVDDTQALGVLGEGPTPERPYGKGGGGSMRWSGAGGLDVVAVSSLAKGFGVPMAVLSGSGDMVERFESMSETRVHSSPPSSAALHAAERALGINEERGEALRARLAGLVGRFRSRLGRSGLSSDGGFFPVQTLRPRTGSGGRIGASDLHARLLGLGIRALLHVPRCRQGTRVSFLINALHTAEAMDRAVEAIAGALSRRSAELGVMEGDHERPTEF